LQCTVADGWAAEVDWPGLGWQLDTNKIAETFYNLLESEIIPLYYERNAQGIPEGWVKRMQLSIQLAPKFSAHRMLQQYAAQLYGVPV